MFLCGTILLTVLAPVSNAAGLLLTIPVAYAPVILAGPAAVVGGVVWLAGVEQRSVYTYTRGAIFGVLTALGNMMFWLTILALVWDPALVGNALLSTGGIVVAFVAAVTMPIALVLGVVLIYVRRARADGLPTEQEPTST